MGVMLALVEMRLREACGGGQEPSGVDGGSGLATIATTPSDEVALRLREGGERLFFSASSL